MGRGLGAEFISILSWKNFELLFYNWTGPALVVKGLKFEEFGEHPTKFQVKVIIPSP